MTLKFARKHLGLAALASCGLLTACNSGGNNNSVTSSNQTATNAKQSDRLGLSDDFFAMQLGAPFETTNNSVTSSQSCLAASANPDNIVITNPSAMVDFSSNSSYSLLQDSLGVDISSQIGGGRWSLSMASSFAKNAKNTAYTMNIIYLYKYAGVAQYKNGTLGQGDAALTTEALNSRNISPYNFRQQCGNDYVAQADAGLVLAVNIQLGFTSSYAANQFKLHTALNTPLGSVISQIQTAAKSQNIDTSMQLSAIQLGGQPQYLNNIFGKPSTSGNYPYIDCGSANISSSAQQAACANTLTNIISYAQSMESQVTTTDGQLNVNNLYYTHPVIQSYMSLGVTEQAPDPGESQLQAMQWLTSTYDNIVNEQTLISHYIDRATNDFDPMAYPDLSDANVRLNNQIQNVFNVGQYNLMNCFRGYVSTQCTDIAAKISQALADPDMALTDTETDLVNNLMTGSYSASLYNFFPLTGESTPPASEKQGNYQKQNSNCVLAPISYSSNSQFMLQCNGQILNTKNGQPILAVVNHGTNVMTITNLDYLATTFDPSISLFMPEVNYGQITATGVTGGFYGSGINVTAGSQRFNNIIATFATQANQNTNGI